MPEESLKIEEYKQIVSQILEIEKHIYSLFQNSVVISSSLLVAIIAYIFNGNLAQAARYDALGLSIATILPALVMMGFFQIIHGLRVEAYFLGKYVQVFYDEAGTGTQFELRLDEYRKSRSVENMDHIVYLFWAFILVCCCMFSFSVLISAADDIALLLQVLILGVGIRMTRNYTTGIRQQSAIFLAKWRSIALKK